MRYSAFSGFAHLGTGSLAETYAASRSDAAALIFDRETGRIMDIDPRFPPDAQGPRPGRPKLGVVAREITLLPKHWDWLSAQPGGASVALRKLVELASRDAREADARREARDSAYRFMHELAGDEPGFEEASRALFAGDAGRFGELVAPWPAGVRDHLLELAGPAFAQDAPDQ
jgi:hypothetical protein